MILRIRLSDRTTWVLFLIISELQTGKDQQYWMHIDKSERRKPEQTLKTLKKYSWTRSKKFLQKIEAIKKIDSLDELKKR